MFTVVGVIARDLGVRSGRLVAAPRGVVLSGGRPAKVKRGKTATYLVVTEGDLAGTRLTLSDSQITMGKPVVAGTRITVELILDKLSAGQSVEQILDAHPRLTREGIQAALACH